MSRHKLIRFILAVASLLLVVPAGTALATEATLSGGEGSQWNSADELITSSGQPLGGDCSFGPDGAGAATLDARMTGGGDAFDFGTMMWVDGTQVGGLVTATANQALFSPVQISGLTVRVRHYALTTQSTLRVLVDLENPTSATISVPLEYVNNFGSDGATHVFASSNGDLEYGPEDRWIVTDDFDDAGGDVANTSVFYGPGGPSEAPVSTSAEVFACAGTQGALDRFQLEIDPGESETLMFFQQLNLTAEEASIDASQFNATPPPGHPLTEGMTPADFAAIVNWDYAPPPACSDGVDNDGDGRVDYPADKGCKSAADTTETNRNRCSDGLDNDDDGRTDFPADPGCASAVDRSEGPDPACSDGADNDGDSLIDFPADPGCSSASDKAEVNPPAKDCSDGVDNDRDGRTDFPSDPGCSSSKDNNER